MMYGAETPYGCIEAGERPGCILPYDIVLAQSDIKLLRHLFACF